MQYFECSKIFDQTILRNRKSLLRILVLHVTQDNGNFLFFFQLQLPSKIFVELTNELVFHQLKM